MTIEWIRQDLFKTQDPSPLCFGQGTICARRKYFLSLAKREREKKEGKREEEGGSLKFARWFCLVLEALKVSESL